MVKRPPPVRIVSPAAAAFLWGRSEARMRRLRLDGALPTRRVEGWGGKPFLAYSYEACCARWGEPDPDRLAALLNVQVLQITSAGSAVWEVIAPRPVVVDENGELAVNIAVNMEN